MTKIASMMFFLFVIVFGISANAAEILPDLGAAPTSWTVDRYQPATFTGIPIWQGHTGVLEIGISAAQGLNSRPAAYQSAFYNTQGMGYALNGVSGDSLSASLWIPQDWQSNTNGNRRTDMWAVGRDSASNISAYSILGFTNVSGTGTFQFWDSNGSWTPAAVTVNYGQWNDLKVVLNASSTMFDYYVNGVMVGSDTGSVGSVATSMAIMQAYNFNVGGLSSTAGTGNYSAYWDNARAGAVPEPSTYMLLSGGLGLLALLRRRRS